MNGSEYTLKLYTALRVDVAEAGGSPMEMPGPDVRMDEAGRKRFMAYYGAMLAAIQSNPPKKDVTSLLKSDFEDLAAVRVLGEKIISVVNTVEDVDGKFFGVSVCRISGELTMMERLALKEYCRVLHDEGLGAKRFRCPACEDHGELSVRVWRDKSHFMLTEQEVECAPWRKQKPKQKNKGGNAR